MALLPKYAGKVDCIFIDPPYNTGKDWSYNDNVNSPMIREWLSDNPIGLEDGLRHDKWASMMWPRLKLLRDLLADHGGEGLPLRREAADFEAAVVLFSEWNAKLPVLIRGGVVDGGETEKPAA